jgi:maltooligosyltrehalose trehalohydrolase
MSTFSPLQLPGAKFIHENETVFSVWAPLKENMILHLFEPNRKISMLKDPHGYFNVSVADVRPGAHYCFMPDGGKDLPDPSSNFQPLTVHGPSAVVDHNDFKWTDSAWRGIPFSQLVIYELHVGTFTTEGNFETIIPQLDELKEIGINALQLMPVAQFPGNRNWGYDAVFPYAVQNSYGGPSGLKKLINACHEKGLAVFLDVVYNHIGPEGNYFSEFGPYFTHKYTTPWGDAINFDDQWCDGVRDYFINNALYWFYHYHFDGLRLDATHMVFDNSAIHFWEELQNRVKGLQQAVGRPLYLIAESDLNSPKTINDPSIGGYGMTAQWLDDFHHALYVIVDKNGKERYYDFGSMEQLSKAYTDGFVHSGEFVKFRKRKHGASSVGIPGDRFVAFNLNHDQIGNRPGGERLCMLVNNERLKIAAAALLLAPYVPMLFMGEEYADRSPFYYFVSHSDPALVDAVRKGRKEEFKNFPSNEEPPDPQAEKTFLDSKLQWSKRRDPHHVEILEWHQVLLKIRKHHPALKSFSKNDVRTHTIAEEGLIIFRKNDEHRLMCAINFSEAPITFKIPFSADQWITILDSKSYQHGEKFKDGNSRDISTMDQVTIPALTVRIYDNVDFDVTQY